MEVLLLGTGSADGWPNPWCGCSSCADALARGELRSPTAALVDGRLLLDCGPEAPRQASRAGVDLAGVGVVLVTHAHSDHLDPAFLLHRSWVRGRPLRVVGPAPVIDRCRDWLAPDQQLVSLVPTTAGAVLEVDGYRVTVLPATHEAFGEAVLYLVEKDGASLLYATDTGPWLPQALAMLDGRPLDLVLLEETFGDAVLPGGHHNLATFARAVDDLRKVGAVTGATRVVAVHLGHHNPGTADLRRRLAACGAEVFPDLSVLRIGVREPARTR